MDYNFYFDESFHDRKIVSNPDGTLNVLKDNSMDSYVGVFWGCHQNKLRPIISALEGFEDRYRKVFTLKDEAELKSSVIKQKNYAYGVHSFSKEALSFYSDLFQILDDNAILIQSTVISKVEWMLRKIFSKSQLPNYVNENSFYYTLAKIICTYKPREIIHDLHLVTDSQSALLFRDSLVDKLETLFIAEVDIDRKEAERSALSEIAFVIENTDMSNLQSEKVDFAYYPNFEALCNLLNEKFISPKKIKLVIDNEEKTYSTATHYNFGKLTQQDSKNVIQIRLADLISGFIGRMIKAIMSDLSSQELTIPKFCGINKEDLIEKRLISGEWFQLTESQFKLYGQIYKVFILNNSSYWATMTLSYADGVSCFYTLIRYINQYETYSEFCAVSTELHREYYNSACCDELERHYKSL